MKHSAITVFLCVLIIDCRAQQPTNSPPGGVVRGNDLPPVLGGNLATGDRPPKPIKMQMPEYPYELRRKGIKAVVTVRFVVRTDGTVVVDQVLNAPDRAFVDAVMTASRGWRFEPGVKHGKVINTRLSVPIYFALDDKNEPPLPTPASVTPAADAPVAPPPGAPAH